MLAAVPLLLVTHPGVAVVVAGLPRLEVVQVDLLGRRLAALVDKHAPHHLVPLLPVVNADLELLDRVPPLLRRGGYVLPDLEPPALVDEGVLEAQADVPAGVQVGRDEPPGAVAAAGHEHRLPVRLPVEWVGGIGLPLLRLGGLGEALGALEQQLGDGHPVPRVPLGAALDGLLEAAQGRVVAGGGGVLAPVGFLLEMGEVLEAVLVGGVEAELGVRDHQVAVEAGRGGDVGVVLRDGGPAELVLDGGVDVVLLLVLGGCWVLVIVGEV
ncbi:hypothetical protein GE09DRAFT_737628 [Coniochaeta sp. 2T2.1]|nr:hypothetical protein GE09DRAFT_737628 [Coniochaeta sp. 2T2.1]